MFPFIKASSIFRSRWIALLWVAFICWMVAGLFGGVEKLGGGENAAKVQTDISGAPVTDADIKRLEAQIKKL